MLFLIRLLREPILHFLVAGGLLFWVAIIIRGPELMPPDEHTIVVDRQSLLSFLQFRSNAFDASAFSQALDAMSQEELDKIIAAYVEEEVLFREAKSLGLDDSDYIIRQRMVQKMQFLLGDLAGGEQNIQDQALESYYEKNKAAYWVQPSVTFTHVFYDYSRHGEESAEELALSELQELNQNELGFNDAVERGERFIFLRNYVERTIGFVEGHFGMEFTRQLSQLQASNSQWQGPLQSVYGQHLVLLTHYSKGRFPELVEVRENVERDYLSELNEAALVEITNSVRDRYTVDIKDILVESQ